MSFLGDWFGGTPKQVSVSTTTNKPPAYAQPYLESIMGRAEDVYNKPREFFPGQTWVDFAPATLEALDRGETRAMAGSPLMGNAQDFLNTAIGGGFLNPAAGMLQSTAAGDYLDRGNPYLTAALQPAINQVQSQMSLSGRLGSGANMGAMTSALAPVYAQNYATERQNQLAAQQHIGSLAQQDLENRAAAAAMAPTFAAADYDDITRLAAYGGAREQKTAEQLADEMGRWDFSQNVELQQLQDFITSVRGGTYGGTTTKPIYGDQTSSAIGNIANLAAAGLLTSEIFT